MNPTPRWTLPALAALGLIAAPVLAAGETLTEKSEQVLDARDLDELVVENARGLVQVRPSTDGRLHLAIWKVCHAENQSHAEQLSRETSVHVDRADGRVTLRVDYPRRIDVRIDFRDLFRHDGISSENMPNAEVRAFVEMPGRAALRVTSVSGDIDVAGLTGRQSLHATSGGITVRDLGGGLELETVSGDVIASAIARSRLRSTSGDIEVNGARGALDVETTSGGLTVNDASDSLRLRSASGDITVARAPRGLDAVTSSGGLDASMVRGTVRARSESGDVNVGLDPGFGDVDVQTSSGGVRVALASGAGARLDLHSSSGELACDLPARVDRSGRHVLTGVIGRGGPVIRLGSLSGDITVTTGGK